MHTRYRPAQFLFANNYVVVYVGLELFFEISFIRSYFVCLWLVLSMMMSTFIYHEMWFQSEGVILSFPIKSLLSLCNEYFVLVGI